MGLHLPQRWLSVTRDGVCVMTPLGFPGWASDLITMVTPSPRLHPAPAGAQGLAGGKASVLCWAGRRGLDCRLSTSPGDPASQALGR